MPHTARPAATSAEFQTPSKVHLHGPPDCTQLPLASHSAVICTSAAALTTGHGIRALPSAHTPLHVAVHTVPTATGESNAQSQPSVPSGAAPGLAGHVMGATDVPAAPAGRGLQSVMPRNKQAL